VQSVSDKMALIRRYSALPVAVGFGIKNEATASAIAPLCDGVVVGSALVDCLAANFDPTQPTAVPRFATELVSAIRSAIDTV
jgi:tryptophan synthase alpha chain